MWDNFLFYCLLVVCAWLIYISYKGPGRPK